MAPGFQLIRSGPVDGPPVVLLHGLARSHRAMRPMAHYLARQGYRIHNVGYPSTRRPIGAVASAIKDQLLAHLPPESLCHCVTHSLGGILVRQLAHDNQGPALGRIVMLAPPNRGSEVVDQLGNSYLFRWVNGPAGQELGTDAASTPNQLGPIGFNCGVIAGTRCRDPLCGRYPPKPSDGKVSVASTYVAGMADHLCLPVGHTAIMRSRRVQAQTAYFLANGRFQRLP